MNDHFTCKPCSELIPGDIVLHPVFRSDHLMFIKKYKRLTSSLIMHLRKQFPPNLSFIIASTEEMLIAFIENKEGQSPAFFEEIRKMVEEHQKFISSLLTLDLFVDTKKPMEKTTNHKKNFIEALGQDVHIPLWDQVEMLFDSPRLLERAYSINKELKELLTNDTSLRDLYKRVSDFHDVLLLNSLNSAFLTFVIGLTLELGNEEMIELILASLFADIGFTEFAKKDYIAYLDNGQRDRNVKGHLKQSIEILSSSAYCRRKPIILGVYDHHERYDGEGNSLGKRGGEIHLYGRIISIAKQYDAMVGGYLKERSILSFDALKELWNQRGKQVDPDIIRIFIDRTNILKVGQTIRTSNNRQGKIIGFKDYIHNPLDILLG